MAGYTDAVVLEAPVFWWPSLAELTKYPIDSNQTFLASIADAAMRWPCRVSSNGSNDASQVHTVGLSRLGRSVWMTATWSALQDGDGQPFVQVWIPTSADIVHLPVFTSAGLASSVSTWDELLQLDLSQLAREGRIRLTHRALPTGLCNLPSSTDYLLKHMRQRAGQHPAFPLLHRTLTQVHTASFNYLKRVVHAATASPSVSLSIAPHEASHPTTTTNSFLFVGNALNQRHLLHLLQLSTPPLLPILHDAHQSAVVIAFEARRLNFAEVLTLNEHEALETIEVALRPPPFVPIPPDDTNATTTAATTWLLPCLLLILEGLHLLDAQANSLVAGVTHQLCMCMDALQESSLPFLVWSFAEDTSTLSRALRSRVGACHIRLATAALEDRAAYLKKRLATLRSQGFRSSATTTAATVAGVVAALSEETANWTIDRLVRMHGTELLKMCAAHGSTAAATQQTSSLLSPCEPKSHDVTNTRDLLHAVYSHLYGIDDDIRKVEELVVWPLTHLPLLRELSIPCSKGVLICGPSGSGKTALLASLVRRLQLPDTRNIHVLSVDGLSLIEKEVGRSEKNIAQLFETARSLAPSALFIDNLDALAPPRGRTMAETNTTGDRTLSTLLTQMDGVNGQASRVVVVVASAPSLDTLDPAVCRPGRLDVHVHLRPPPVHASVTFMKQRLQQFVTSMWLRLRVSDANETAAESEIATDFVNTLVEDYFAAVTTTVDAVSTTNAEYDKQSNNKLENSVTPAVSPAEVTAVVREVMLYVAERLMQSTSGEKELKRNGALVMALRLYVAEAFARLGTTH